MYRITSLHHQMVNPGEVKHKLIAYSQYPRSVTYLDGDDKEIELEHGFLEPEIVWFPKTKSLGIQGHPEMTQSGLLHEYLNKLVNEYLEKSC